MDERMWHTESERWVRVIERNHLFNQDVVKVVEEGKNAVYTVLANTLTLNKPFELPKALSVAAGSRIWQAMSSDLFLSPIVSKVIPLPHQFRVLRKALSAYPVRKLLADEVGLGKTIEAGLIYKELKLRGLADRVLVLAPKSLLLQWISEMNEHFGEEFELVEPGSWSASAVISNKNKWKKITQAIASYDSVKPRDNQKGWTQEKIERFNLERFYDLVGAGWDLVIFDESHKMAGASDDVARHELAKGLARAVPNILLLSATPHSGKSDAFTRLLSLLEPDHFTAGVSLNKDTVAPYLIRTEKRNTTDGEGNPLFAPRNTSLVKVPFEDRHHLQKQLYESVSEYVRSGYNLVERKGTKKGYRLLLLLIQRLMSSSTRAIRTFLENRLTILSDDGSNVNISSSDDIGEDADMDDVAQLALFSVQQTSTETDDVRQLLDLAIRTENAGSDARAEAMYHLMVTNEQKESDPSTKFLIFTEFTTTQEMLKEFLTLRGYSVVTINGSMNLEERKIAQDDFRNESQVLVSTDAGGEGLNLQFAHIVINYDLPWNPMRVEQRIGRVDRIGQKQNVSAYNLVLENSIEARIYEVWLAKLATILTQLGIDKTGDVLDSSDTASQFERLAKAALISPELFDTEFERIIVEIKKAANERQTLNNLADTNTDAFTPIPNVPLHSWLETLLLDDRVHRFDGSVIDLSTVALERINNLRCHYALNKPVPILKLTGMNFELESWFSIWKVGIAEGMWRQQYVFALCMADNGESYTQSAQRIWDELALNKIEIEFEGEIETVNFDAIRLQAENKASELYEQIVKLNQERVRRRMNSINLSYLARKRSMRQIGLDEVREERLRDLEIEYNNQRAEMALASQSLPDMQCLFLSRVKVK